MNERLLTDIRDSLHDDLASYGFLLQCVKTALNQDAPRRSDVQLILEQLLALGDICIGEARLANADYVQFTGWKGELSELVERAFRAVDGASEQDKPFAFWLCLASNVDRFENHESSTTSRRAEQCDEPKSR
jgi:hypothetical protein